MKKVLFCVFVLPLFLLAQNDDSDSLKLKAGLSLTGFWQGGNVEALIFRAKSDVSYRPWNKLHLNSRTSYVYQEFGRVQADEDFLSLNFLYLYPKKQIYPIVIGIASSSFRMQIDLRYLIGVGITCQILEEKDNWLKLSISSELEKTTFRQDNFNLSVYDGSRTISTYRGTLWVNGSHQFLDDKLIFKHESYVQPSLQRGNNFRWRTDLSLEVPIKKYLSFKFNYVHSYESIVVRGLRLADRIFSFGVDLKNY